MREMTMCFKMYAAWILENQKLWKKKKRFPSHEEKQINRRNIIVFPSLFVAMRIKEILNRSN